MGKITKAIKGKFKKAAKKPPPPSPFQPHQQQKRLKKNIAAYSNNRRQQPHHLQAAKSEPDEIYDYYDDGSEVYDDSYDDEYYYHNGFESMRAAHSMRTRGQYIPHLERENNRLKRLKTVQLKNDKVRLSTNTDQVKSSWRLQLPFALRTKSQQKNRVYR